MDSDIMGDFEADSLDIVDMVMTLEDEFGIEVPDDAIENLRTVGDVVNFVDSHKGCATDAEKPRIRASAHGRESGGALYMGSCGTMSVWRTALGG